MNDWPKNNSEEAKGLRAEISEIKSPLASLVNGMSQDQSLVRIDNALNLVGEGFGIFNTIKNDEHAKELFDQIKALTDIDDPKAVKTAAEELVKKINELSDAE